MRPEAPISGEGKRKGRVSGFLGPDSSAHFTGRATYQIEALDEYNESAMMDFPIGVRFHAARGKIEMVNSGPFSNNLEIEIHRHQHVREAVRSRNMPSEFQGEVPVNFRYFQVSF